MTGLAPAEPAKSVVDWLIDGARSAPLAQEVLTELCERLTAVGLPLWRAMVFVRTLHPEVVGRRFIWRPDTGTVITDGGFELLERDVFRNSPMVHVSETGNALRRRIADPDCPMDFPVLHDLRDEGVTDYVVSPLHFTNGEFHFASWATRQPGGFSDADIALIDSIIAPLTRVAEIRAYYRVAGNLLATYVGKNAGERVLAGRIRRGDTEAIHAAIWLSDMRGFTRLAEGCRRKSGRSAQSLFRLPGAGDRRAGRRSTQIHGRRAVGDISDRAGADARQVCAAALKAAQARAEVAALHAAGGEGAAVRFGLALHVGDVLYGNIGSGNRLDFTCIGPAVNLAARLEKLAGRLGRTILASQEFAKYCRTTSADRQVCRCRLCREADRLRAR